MEDRCPEVVSDPEIRGGEPVFRGTRTPVKILWDYLESGSSLDDFFDNYPQITREQAVAVIRYGRLATMSHASAA